MLESRVHWGAKAKLTPFDELTDKQELKEQAQKLRKLTATLEKFNKDMGLSEIQKNL